MTYFARKLEYGAHDDEAGAQFMALLEIAKKKGGRPIEFVLYQRIMQYYYPSENVTRMIRFTATTAEEAIKRFWPWNEGTGKEFPGWESDRWEKTTPWLYPVAVGGSYEGVRPGDWVRVGVPAPWRNRHRKSGGKSCDTACQLRQLEREMRHVREQLLGARSDISVAEYNLRNFDDDDGEEAALLADAVTRTEVLEPKLGELGTRVRLLTDELRYGKAKKFGVPYWPRQEDGTLKKAA